MELLRESELAALLKIGVGSLAGWRREGSGPPYLKIGKSVRYERESVDAWIATRRVSET